MVNRKLIVPSDQEESYSKQSRLPHPNNTGGRENLHLTVHISFKNPKQSRKVHQHKLVAAVLIQGALGAVCEADSSEHREEKLVCRTNS